jgi:hypothetical protein
MEAALQCGLNRGITTGQWGGDMFREEKKVQLTDTRLFAVDGRRFGPDRRIFSYAEFFPERRSGKDRRCNSNRSTPRLYLVNRA